jgi:hypothetical protein
MVIRIDKFTDEDQVPLYSVTPVDASEVGTALSCLCDAAIHRRGGLQLPDDVVAAARDLWKVLDRYKTTVPQ